MEERLRPLSLGMAGIRGEAGSGLSPEKAADFGALCAGGRVLVARDSRRSSPMFQRIVSSSLAGCGCDVADGGVMPAGMIHFLTMRHGFAGALMVSGGHQKPGWNAIVPFQHDGAYFDALRCRELLDLYHGRRFREADYLHSGRYSVLPPECKEEYWQFIASCVATPAIRKKNLTVLADFGNGAGAPYAERFAELFNLRLIAMNDGKEPVNTRLPDVNGVCEEPLGKLIAPLGAALGMVFNSDMSRLGLVSDSGEPLTEELTFPIAAAWYLKKNGAKKPLIVNSCSSMTLDDLAKSRQCRLVKCRVGQSEVIQTMRRENAGMGGEGSGAFTFGGMPGFDAFLMAALILESVVLDAPLSAQMAGLKRYSIVKMTIPCRTSHGYALLKKLKSRINAPRVSETDGVRFDWHDGFLSLRLAETEPVVRLISEAEKAETAHERAWQARLMLESQVAK